MADANTGTAPQGGGSEPDKNSAGQAAAGALNAPAAAPIGAEPEPVILEETVIRPAPPKTASPAAPSGLELLPPVSPPPQPAPTSPPAASEPRPIPAPAPERFAVPTGLTPPERTEARASGPRMELSSSALAAGISPISRAAPLEAPDKQASEPKLAPPAPRAEKTDAPSVGAVNTARDEIPRVAPTPIPAAAIARVSTFVPGQSASPQQEIASILAEVKLPERRERQAPESTAVQTPPAVQPPPVPAADRLPTRAAEIASSIVAPLRTLKHDLQEVVRKKNISLVRAAALEQEKRFGREGHERAPHPESARRGVGILLAALLLIVLGAGAFFGVYIIEQQRSAGAPSASQSPSIVFSESTVALPLEDQSAADLKRLLANARTASSATLGSITRVVPVVSTVAEGVAIERAATLEEFLAALGTRASPDLLRALSGEFFFGIHTVDENAPLFVIPVISYERAFAGLLAWEGSMNSDLAPAFTPVPDQVIGAGGLPQKRQFYDEVMRNYDVRVLKDDSGTIQLYYSFPTQNLLIIAESPYSFTEILSRLRAERKI